MTEIICALTSDDENNFQPVVKNFLKGTSTIEVTYPQFPYSSDQSLLEVVKVKRGATENNADYFGTEKLKTTRNALPAHRSNGCEQHFLIVGN